MKQTITLIIISLLLFNLKTTAQISSYSYSNELEFNTTKKGYLSFTFGFKGLNHTTDPELIDVFPPIIVLWNGVEQKVGWLDAWGSGGTTITSPMELSGKTRVVIRCPVYHPISLFKCNNNEVIEINFSPAGNLYQSKYIEKVECNNNQLNSLSLRTLTNLSYLDCSYNAFTQLDLSSCTSLETINCSNNQLTSINLSNNNKLLDINCSYNQLSSLELNNCTKLKYINCLNNQLTSLFIEKCTQLSSIICTSNKLVHINISPFKKLREIYCAGNQLTELDASGLPVLASIGCAFNKISKLNISGSANLLEIEATDNNLSSLDISGSPDISNLSLRDNSFRFSTLPKKKIKYVQNLYGGYSEYYFFSPQAAIQGGKCDYEKVDLSSEYTVERIQGEEKLPPTITSYRWYEIVNYWEKREIADSEYVNNNGVFSFSPQYIGKKLLCEMINYSFWEYGILPAYTRNTELTLQYEVTLTGDKKNSLDCIREDNNIIIYYNRKSDCITINGRGNLINRVEILDTQGMVLMDEKINNAENINLPVYNYPKGILIVKVNSDKGMKYLKVIK